MSQPKYWRSLQERVDAPKVLAETKDEFPADAPFEEALEGASEEKFSLKANRRDFLKLMGFSVGAAALAACNETPLKKAIPYVEKPDDVIPGIPNYYASTTPEGVPVLVKTREGRPIKMEGNPDYNPTNGKLDAYGQAEVLGVYDQDRLRGPLAGSQALSWDQLDQAVKDRLSAIRARQGKIRVVSRSVSSPTTRAVLNDFVGEGGQWIEYDPVSYSAMADAHRRLKGKRGIPNVQLENADVILGVNCDFLGTWLNPTEMNARWVANRNPNSGSMSRHFQLESMMTITGANADMRFPIKPSQEGTMLANLYNKVAAAKGRGQLRNVPSRNLPADYLDQIARELVAANGRAVVLCGTNDIATQELVANINDMLGAYGPVLDMDHPIYLRQGNDEAIQQLAEELPTVDAVIFYNCNPVYDTPFGARFGEALTEMSKDESKLTLSTAYQSDETSALCQFTAPDNHFLESWGDAQLVEGVFSVIQPVINPLFNTRQAQDSFLLWMGSSDKYYSRMRNWWTANLQGASKFRNPGQFWEEVLRRGVLSTTSAVPLAASSGQASSGTAEAGAGVAATASTSGNVNEAARLAIGRDGGDETLELMVYERVGMRDGRQANNPWLQELPDPITRVSWDNYLTVPYSYARDNGIETGDVVTVTAGDVTFEAPVVVQPGQAMNTFGLATGYGRAIGGRVIQELEETGNVPAFPLVQFQDGSMQYSVPGVSIEKTGAKYDIATIQTYHTLFDPQKKVTYGDYFDRTEQIISETHFEAFKDDPNQVNAERVEKRSHLLSLWESHYVDQPADRYIRWAMAIDLNKCTGCGACVVACNAENNVPVVGKKEVKTRREMHWMRIDRYYSGDPDRPDVAFQPMLCQHCDNAPCETVCPVLATIHSTEGLNQMTYNRCVGTRYCANNCPYKVRRFNWFNYYNGEQFANINPANIENPIGSFVLNPDVTVRFRGVMEKCSFCVQRLQAGKLSAKLAAGSGLNPDGTAIKPRDGAIQTACQQTCPTGAIVFGDLNDPDSEIAKAYSDVRRYHALEEVKTLPSVAYKSIVRNRTNAEAEAIELRTREVMDEEVNAWREYTES